MQVLPQISIQRDSCLANRIRAYRVLLDGVEVARVQNGATVTFDAPVGTHELKVKFDWIRSRPLNVQVPVDGTLLVRCSTSGNPLEMLKAGLGMSSSHLTLTIVDGSAAEQVAPISTGVRLRKAGIWLGGSIAVGFVLAMVVGSLSLPAASEARLSGLVGQVTGFVGVLGAMWIAFR